MHLRLISALSLGPHLTLWALSEPSVILPTRPDLRFNISVHSVALLISHTIGTPIQMNTDQSHSVLLHDYASPSSSL